MKDIMSYLEITIKSTVIGNHKYMQSKQNMKK